MNLNITHADPSQDLEEVAFGGGAQIYPDPEGPRPDRAGRPGGGDTHLPGPLRPRLQQERPLLAKDGDPGHKILGRSVRTVQRHLHVLRELGLVDFVERRRNLSRFSSYIFRVVHFVELIRRKKGPQPPDTQISLKTGLLYFLELNR